MPWNMLISEIISHGNYYTALTNANDNQPHCHEFIEIFYVIQGAASHNLNGKQKMVELGDVYLLKPTDFHSFSSVDSAPFLHRDICIKADEFKKVCDFIRPNLYQDLLNDKSVIQSKLNIEELESFEHLIKSFSPLNEDTYEQVLKVVTTSVVFLFAHEASTEKAMPDWVRQLVDYMQSPYHYQYPISKLTKDLHFSKQYICYTFKKYIGTSITDYFLNQRINYAKYLIMTTTDPIGNIAYSAGFNNLTFFYRSFKKKFGVTPLQLRKQSGGGG